ncbi:MAG: formate--tetrahydrofolate ligase [Flavobacteriales bacterium]|nr:formate--tetrahydrofolate ligase [Flavobacteriales bacterium]
MVPIPLARDRSCGEIMRMPGLPEVPAAEGMDIDANGVISGLSSEGKAQRASENLSCPQASSEQAAGRTSVHSIRMPVRIFGV